MKAVELFSGVGLSAIGLVKTGMDLVGACDKINSFVEAFNQQDILPHVATCSDIDTYEIPSCDLLSAGPVCKAFSPGATVFGSKGSEDERNTFPHLFRAVERYSPKYVLIENSYGLQRFKGYVEEILTQLHSHGYKIDWQEIDCYDYGVPQHRKRLVFLCSKGQDWKVSKPEKRIGKETVGDCMESPPEGDLLPLTKALSTGELAYWNRDPRHAKKHVPLNFSKPASTVVSNYKRGVPYGVIQMPDGALHLCNPRLAARLQGIPDEFKVDVISRTRMLEGIGNGFPPPVIQHIVSRIPL